MDNIHNNRRFPAMVILGILMAIILGFLVAYYLFWRVGPDGAIHSLGEFLPFGRVPEGSSISDRSVVIEITPEVDRSLDVLVNDRPILEKITDKPVAGAFIMPPLKNDVPAPYAVRYMERATGHTYGYTIGEHTESADTREQRLGRLTNTTIPRVYEAVWVEKGQGVIARFLAADGRTIRSFFGKINLGSQATSSTGILEGVFLPENITSLHASPDGSLIFYITYDGSVSSMVRSSPDGSSARLLHSTPLKYWQAQWPAKGQLIISSKPSYRVSGFAHSMDLAGASKGIAYRVNGLTVLGDQISRFFLFGGQYNTGYSLSVFDSKTHKGNSLPLTTIPEKCVWSEKEDAVFCGIPKSGVGQREPDSWYMGLTHFNDDIWKIDVETGATEKIIDLAKEAGVPIDVVDLQISKDDRLIIFRNKDDGSLWALSLPDKDKD